MAIAGCVAGVISRFTRAEFTAALVMASAIVAPTFLTGANAQTTPTLLSVRVTAEDGQPVAGAEVIALSKRDIANEISQLGKWKPATGGTATFTQEDFITRWTTKQSTPTAYQIIARAPGYAFAMQQVPLADDPQTINLQMNKGRELTIHLVPPPGREIPSDLRPWIIPKELVAPTWAGLDIAENPEPVSVAVPQPGPDGAFTFNIPDDSPPLYLMIHHPGFLRTWQPDEPIETTATAPVKIELPRTATADITFDNPYADYTSATEKPILKISVMHKMPGYSEWIVQPPPVENPIGQRHWRLDDLPPGRYYFMAQEGIVESKRIDGELAAGEQKTFQLAAESVIPPVVAVDENGTTLTEFEARLSARTRMGPSSRSWQSVGTGSKKGMVQFPRSVLSNSYANTGASNDFTVSVRAPGYAMATADVTAGAPNQPPVVVKLNRGEKLTIVLKPGSNRTIPADLMPIILDDEQYPASVNYLSNPENAPALAVGRRVSDNTFEFNLPKGTRNFRVALSDKDFVKNFVTDLIPEIPATPLEIPIPVPGTVEVNVTVVQPDQPAADQSNEPHKAIVSIKRTLKGTRTNYLITYGNSVAEESTTTVFTNLPPGDYVVDSRPFSAGVEGPGVGVVVRSRATATVALTAKAPTGPLDRFGRPKVVFPTIKVTSDDGTPVSGTQIIARKKSTRSIPTLKWINAAADGTAKVELDGFFNESHEGAYEILVRAPGYASTIHQMDIPTSATEIPIKLSAHRHVTLQLTDDAGREIPADLIPAVFPESWGVSVWLTAQSDTAASYTPETLLSPYSINRATDKPGRFTLNIDEKSTEPLYALINHPGFLRAFQAGPFNPSEWATSGTAEITLPEPAVLSGTVDLNGNKPESTVATLELGHTRKVPGANRWGLRLVTEEMPATSASLTVADLAPGEYDISVTMAPKDQRFGGDAFSTEQSAKLDAGASESLTLKYAPFKKEWLQGPYTAKVKVLNQKGEPAVGAEYQVTWYERGYPRQTIAQGKVPENGMVIIKNLAGIEKPATREELKERGGAPTFDFQAGGQRLGYISFFEYESGKYTPPKHGNQEEEFEYRIPPAEGDAAPDFAMHDIATSKTINFSDLKGQVVLIDFWATWCGPCQGPMAENQAIMRKHKEDWKGKATILAVSIDDELETVKKHLDKNDWHETHNTWAAPEAGGEAGWSSPAAELYGINSIPTMIIVDKDGVIRKRGHVSDIEGEMLKYINAAPAATARDDAKRNGGGDIIKIPLIPPGSETSYTPIAAPSAETSYGVNPSSIAPPGSETSYSTTTRPSSTDLRVALFADPKSTDEKSREAMWPILSAAPGIVAARVLVEDVRKPDFFDNYDVFILPGGSGGGEAKAIGVEAGQEIARRIKEGKGLIAVCAGGYYVAEGWDPATAALDIINAENHDGKHWARGEQFIAVEVVGDDDVNSSRTMWYENGPIFKPATIEGMPNYVPLVKYVTDLAAKDAPKGQMGGRDAVIAAPYGKGRVVAFGPHPELSPELNHWLTNAIKWSATKTTGPINAQTVLEGQ